VHTGVPAKLHQVFPIVRMRAADNQRWMLRSADEGITASIDPAGRLRMVLPC
jgi:apolipoprotein N-acyltransferase